MRVCQFRHARAKIKNTRFLATCLEPAYKPIKADDKNGTIQLACLPIHKLTCAQPKQGRYL